MEEVGKEEKVEEDRRQVNSGVGGREDGGGFERLASVSSSNGGSEEEVDLGAMMRLGKLVENDEGQNLYPSFYETSSIFDKRPSIEKNEIDKVGIIWIQDGEFEGSKIFLRNFTSAIATYIDFKNNSDSI